jgi:hypothetical protein
MSYQSRSGLNAMHRRFGADPSSWLGTVKPQPRLECLPGFVHGVGTRDERDTDVAKAYRQLTFGLMLAGSIRTGKV